MIRRTAVLKKIKYISNSKACLKNWKMCSVLLASLRHCGISLLLSGAEVKSKRNPDEGTEEARLIALSNYSL